MSRLTLLTSLSLLCLAFAPAPFPKTKRQPRPDGPSMEGLWRRGRDGTGEKVRITPTAWKNSPEGGGQDQPDFLVKHYPHTSPPSCDLSRPGTGELYLLCIYKIEGDLLTLCYNYADKQLRPTAFDGPGGGAGIETFMRAR